MELFNFYEKNADNRDRGKKVGEIVPNHYKALSGASIRAPWVKTQPVNSSIISGHTIWVPVVSFSFSALLTAQKVMEYCPCHPYGRPAWNSRLLSCYWPGLGYLWSSEDWTYTWRSLSISSFSDSALQVNIFLKRFNNWSCIFLFKYTQNQQ